MRPHSAGKKLVRAGDEKQVISLQWPKHRENKLQALPKTDVTYKWSYSRSQNNVNVVYCNYKIIKVVTM